MPETDERGAVARARPLGADRPVELHVAGSALKAIAVLALPVLGAGSVAAGSGGLLGAGLAIALVGGMFAISAALLSLAARFGPSALLAAALGGFALRLALYGVLLVVLEPVEAIHGPTLAIASAVLLVVTLAFEAWHVSRRPELFWLDVAPSTEQRSQA